MTLTGVDVVIIRGAPGAGKSQTAKCLTAYYPGGVKVEVDILRRMVISVDWKNQKEHINLLQVAARLTRDFCNLGFRPVIVVDTFSGDKVNRFVNTLRHLDNALNIRIFGLHVPDEVLRKRLNERPGDEFKDYGISKKLNAEVLEVRYPGEIHVDSASLSPKQTAGKIHRLLSGLAGRNGAKNQRRVTRP